MNRIRYAVKVGADDRCYLLLSAQERDYKKVFVLIRVNHPSLDHYSPFYDAAIIGGTSGTVPHNVEFRVTQMQTCTPKSDPFY